MYILGDGNLLTSIEIYNVIMLYNRLTQVDNKKPKPMYYVVIFGYIPRCSHDIPNPIPVLSAIDNTPCDSSIKAQYDFYNPLKF